MCVDTAALLPLCCSSCFSPVPLSCRTPLHAAAFAGHVDCVQLLLSHDASVNAVDQSGRSALMMAAEKGRVGALGTELFYLTDSLALEHCCCSKAHLEFDACLSCFNILLRCCVVDVYICFLHCVPEVLLTSTSHSLTDSDGNTALHLACSNVSVHTLHRY